MRKSFQSVTLSLSRFLAVPLMLLASCGLADNAETKKDYQDFLEQKKEGKIESAYDYAQDVAKSSKDPEKLKEVKAFMEAYPEMLKKKQTADTLQKRAEEAALDAKHKEIDDLIAKNFRKEYNEYDKTTYYYHKSSPMNLDADALYCYFYTRDVGSKWDRYSAYNFRFRIQYNDDDWLFIEKMQFLINGETVTIDPKKMEREVLGHGNGVTEWMDVQPNRDELELIKKLSRAQSAKMKLTGKHFSDERTISAKQTAALKDCIHLYKLMDGDFTNGIHLKAPATP